MDGTRPLHAPATRTLRGRAIAVIVVLGSAGSAAATPVDALLSTVAPGTTVRWVGAGTEACSLAEQSFAPIGDTCWYPIDLLQPAGPLTIGRTRGGRTESRIITVSPYPYPEQRLTVDASKVDLSAKDLARVERETAQVAGLWSSGRAIGFTVPLHDPLAALRGGTRFGARRFFNGEPRSPHSGVDYKASTGTPVLAAEAGVVVLADDHFFSGNSVFIDHGGDLVTMYFHLHRLQVQPGDRVERGQRIGTVGKTGRATGPHLHFGVRWHGARVDPRQLLGSAKDGVVLED